MKNHIVLKWLNLANTYKCEIQKTKLNSKLKKTSGFANKYCIELLKQHQQQQQFQYQQQQQQHATMIILCLVIK